MHDKFSEHKKGKKNYLKKVVKCCYEVVTGFFNDKEGKEGIL